MIHVQRVPLRPHLGPDAELLRIDLTGADVDALRDLLTVGRAQTDREVRLAHELRRQAFAAMDWSGQI